MSESERGEQKRSMSRREDRDSDSKRHRTSRLDTESSPKRKRGDGNPESEKISRSTNWETKDYTTYRDQRHLHKQVDAPYLKAPVNKDSEKISNVHQEAAKLSSDPKDAPRPRSFVQHDERDLARQAGRSFGRRGATERGWRDSRNEREANKSAGHDIKQRDPKREEDKSVWRHDRFSETEANSFPPGRKRPAFREKKIIESEPFDKMATEPIKVNSSVTTALGNERQEERDRKTQHLDKRERLPPNRREANRDGFQSRERYGYGSENYRVGDRNGGRQGFNSGDGGRTQKWKHDLFQEANRSPTPKNEEDQIAKVEALLAS